MAPRRIVVIGGGLSGLAATSSLLADGHDVVLLEAQDRLGGRVLTASLSLKRLVERSTAELELDQYDLGPTWCWPEHQPRMAAFLQRHGLAVFAQPRHGGLVYELSPTQQRRVAGDGAADGSIRVKGGMQAVIDALVADIAPAVIQRNRPVTSLQVEGEALHVTCTAPNGTTQTLAADVVLCTLPPRLAATTLSFAPALPASVLARWTAVPTWMAGHAKFVAVYDHAFWRAQGLSGEVRSQVGPLAEVHDATTPSGKPALFGFVGVPAAVRQHVGDAAIEAACLAQLVRVFGEAARHPAATFFKDWSTDRWVATAADAVPPPSHPLYGAVAPMPAPWTNRLILAGTESAPVHGGYLEGALEAAEQAVAEVRRHLQR